MSRVQTECALNVEIQTSIEKQARKQATEKSSGKTLQNFATVIVKYMGK